MYPMVLRDTNDIKKTRLYMMYWVIALAEYFLFSSSVSVVLVSLLLDGNGNGVGFRRLLIMLFELIGWV